VITRVGATDRRRTLVRRAVLHSTLIVAITAIAAVVALVLFAQHSDLILKTAFAVGGLLVALRILNDFGAHLYGETDDTPTRRRRRTPERQWPPELLEIEGRVSLARVSAFDHQSRLRPLLREIALHRLAAGHNLDVTREPDRARSLLGVELWNEVQPASPSRDLRDSPGPTLAMILRMVENIEAI
jgi:hypothetical protein